MARHDRRAVCSHVSLAVDRVLSRAGCLGQLFRASGTSARTLSHLLAVILALLPSLLSAAVFSGNARVEAADPSGALSWTNTANALTVSCWFKLSVPSDKTLSENMTILVNRRTGNESSLFAYLIRYNFSNGNVEFLSRGTSGLFTDTLISAPYLERWYHVAVIRSGDVFTGYVDGRKAFEQTLAIGNSGNSDGVSVGGWGTMGSGTYLYGEVQEVAVYQTALDVSSVIDNMFRDQPSDLLSLKGYYKLGYSENTSDGLRNFAPAPPTNTTPAVVSGSGQVTFEEANQAGEQSAFDSRKNGGADALAPLSGSFSWGDVLLARPVPGIAFDLRMSYSSANAFNGSGLGGTDTPTLGKGWRHSFETRIIPSSYFSAVPNVNAVGLMSWDGAIETWEREGSTKRYKTRHKEYRGELFEKDDQTYEWVTPERLVYRFRNPMSGSLVMGGRLIEIVDSNNNAVKVAYQESSGLVTQVVDTVGGLYRFSYGAQNLCTNIAFQGWAVNFAYDAQNRLVTNSLSAPAGYAAVNTVRTFAYEGAGGLLKTVTDPRGNAAVTVTYDKYGRMTNQVDALSRRMRTEYGVPGKRQITRTDADGFKWVETYDRKGRVTANADPLGNMTRKTYDAAGNVRTLTDPRSSVTAFDYDERANILTNVNALAQKRVWTYHPYYNKPLTETDPLGWTTHYEYDAAGNMTNQWDGIGSLVRYAYDDKGLVTAATDANGNVTRFGYDANGYKCRTVDPAGYTNTVGLNELGWTLAATNALGQVTTFAYDVNGNVVQTTDPLYRVITSVFDANGNKVSQSDAKGQLTLSYYDAANQRTQMTDRAGAISLVAYTPRGEVWKVTDAQSNTVVNAYDAANRLVTVKDPLGGAVSNVYDAAGNLTDSYDKLGQRWRKTYDRLNRVVAEQDPLGNTRRVTFDAAGRLDTVTSPNGFVSTHQYDGRGRLRRWVDAEGYVWLYEYDGVGSITNITDALGGHYVMTYGPRNERTLERNQDGFEWRYAYDALLRPLQQNDPNGLVRSVVYDDGGRVDYVGFSTGRTDDYQYDDNDNLTLLSRSRPGQAPTPTSLVFDPMDRPTQVTDAFGKTVKYVYDNLSRVDTLTYPGSRNLKYRYDALSRLTNQTDWASRRLDYAFDKANRLVRRVYPNGIVQTNAFDTAGRITDLSCSSSASNSFSVALTYAYDRNGNKTTSTEKGTLDWPQPTRIDETARYTAAGRLIDRTDAASTNAPWAYHYDASGNMTNAVGAGQSFTLTYDEDNRVLTVDWECGLTSKRIENRYDALGRRISRKVDGVETRYVLDIQGGMERILCDTTAAGQITATYIHGNDLAYRVASDNSYVCYHADAQANIIALTDSGGTNVAQYAYTPYGRSLGSSVGSGQSAVGRENPYRFVGSQGVMEELPGLYFMRARYYSAEAGVFLSTDPVKHIGPGWKPVAYGYGDGNPLTYTDPQGEIALIDTLAAAGIGAVVGGGFELVSQLGSGSEVNWAEVGGAAVGGAVQGSLISMGVPVSMAGAIGGAAGDVTTQLAEGSEFGDINWEQTGQAAFKSGASSALGSIALGNTALGKVISPHGQGWNAAAGMKGFQTYGSMYKAGGNEIADRFAAKAKDVFMNRAIQSVMGGNGQQSVMSQKTPAAGSYGQNITATYSKTSSSSSSKQGTTTGGGGGSSCSSSSFAKTVSTVKASVSKASNNVSSKVKSAVTSVKQSVSSVVKSVKSFVSKIFGGGKKK